MALGIVFTLAVCMASFIGADRRFPHPWLTEDRAARVLKLGCQPPKSPSPPWTRVYDIRVFVCPTARAHSNCVNQSVVNFTSAMTEPKRGSVLPAIANVSFNAGEWSPIDPPSLSVVMPFTREYYGDFFCTIEYSDPAGIQKYSAKLRLDASSEKRQSLPVRTDNFEAEIIKAHNVTVTWQPPADLSEFLEGRVTRTLTDKDGRATSAPRSLFMATSSRQFDFDDGDVGVLLTEIQRPPAEATNFSMTVFVESGEHSRFYRYSCRVSYPDCVGPDARFCSCDVIAIPSPASASGDAAAIFFALFLVACIIAVAVLIILMKRGKLPRLKALLNAATSDKEISTDIAINRIDTQTPTTQPAADQPEGQEEEARGVNNGQKLVVGLPQDGSSERKMKTTPPVERNDRRDPHPREGSLGRSMENIPPLERTNRHRHPAPDPSSGDDGSIKDLNVHGRNGKAIAAGKLQKKRSRPHRDEADELSSRGESDEEESATTASSPLMPQTSANTNTSSARTEPKHTLGPSPQQLAAQPPPSLGNGGAKLKGTHKNADHTFLQPPVALSQTADVGRVENRRSRSSPSALRHSDDPDPSRGQGRTRNGSQPVGGDVDVSPGNRDSSSQSYPVHSMSQSASPVTTSNDKTTQPQPDTGHTHFESYKEV